MSLNNQLGGIVDDLAPPSVTLVPEVVSPNRAAFRLSLLERQEFGIAGHYDIGDKSDTPFKPPLRGSCPVCTQT
jgi:hypothetical protein